MTYPALQSVTNAFQTSTLADAIPASTSVTQKFGVGPRNGWSEVDSKGVKNNFPLGASGPFVLLIGSEKILCATDATGIIYVQSDGTNWWVISEVSTTIL
jgi:hypothetical protein